MVGGCLFVQYSQTAGSQQPVDRYLVRADIFFPFSLFIIYLSTNTYCGGFSIIKNKNIFILAYAQGALDVRSHTHEIKQDIDRHSIYIICCSYGKHFADWYSWVGARQQQLQITGENSVSIEIISGRTGLDIATGKYLSENI